MKYWNYPEFRDGQLDVIKNIYNGTDTLAVLPTGAGKSICYQVPGLMMDGITIVISPLIALMNDQIRGLKQRGIKAAGVMSGQSTREQDIILDNAAYGQLKFLFVSPERLQSKLFRHRLTKYNISMLVIDEAHCISEWGHDFRPEYRMIEEVMSQIRKVPYLALTATATTKVQEDIRENLKMESPSTFLHSPLRHNISYKVYLSENKSLVLRQLIKSCTEGCIIVYVSSRKLTIQLQRFLDKHNIHSAAFHGGMKTKQRNQIIEQWENGEVKIMISTKAFGMGIDKSDVRKVIHYNIPESLEAYVQEAGRAGRDGEASEAVLISNQSDLSHLEKRQQDIFPDIDFIRKVYVLLGVYYRIASGMTTIEDYIYNHNEFCTRHHLPKFKTINALKLLSSSDLIQLTESVSKPATLHLDEFSIKQLIRREDTSDQLKNFIRVILRTFEGVFFTDVTIDEELISQRTQLTKEKVIKGLNWLQKLNYGRYKPTHEGALIRFNNYRYKDNDVKINEGIYKGMKQRYEQSISSIKNYIKTPQCRQRIIAEYFNAEEITDCGTCDNCTINDHHDISQLKESVVHYLELDIDNMDELVSCFDYNQKNEVLNVIQVLESEGKYYMEGNKLKKR